MSIGRNNWDVETYRNKLEKGFIPPSILMLVMKIEHMAIFALNISTYVIGISPIVCPILIYYISTVIYFWESVSDMRSEK